MFTSAWGKMTNDSIINAKTTPVLHSRGVATSSGSFQEWQYPLLAPYPQKWGFKKAVHFPLPWDKEEV